MTRRPSADAATRFEGFADAEARFFRALAKHQNRDWFQAHRQEYEDGWARPMKLLLDEVRERIDPLFLRHALGDPKVFRIYRDVRFSKDKSPYKTHIGGYIPMQGGGAGPEHPTPLYLHLGNEGPFAAAGHYVMNPAQVARYREAVLDDKRGKALVKLVAAVEKAGGKVEAYDELKKVPRGFDPDHPRAEFLRKKSLTVTFPTLPKRLLVSRALVTWLVTQVERARPVVEWLAELAE